MKRFGQVEGGGSRFRLPGRITKERAWRLAAFGLLFLFLVVFAGLGFGGITEVKDNEVAVFVNYLTGNMTVDTDPGNKIFIPFIQEVFTLDKSPNRFVMEGKADASTDHVRELTVRARDGSNFWFDTITIQYQLLPSQAAHALGDSGTEDAFKKFWLMSYARSILRDEFGKFDPEEISNPANYSRAGIAAQDRMNEALRPHGIEVTQITMPKPRFSDEYEKAIEDRKLADQEVERLKAEALQLEKEKAKRLAEIESTKGQEFAALKGTLAAGKTTAEAEQIKLRREADAYKIQRTGEGEAERLAKIEEARGLTEKYEKEAQGLLAKAEALAKQGSIVVVEALAEKLADVEIEVVPYRRSEAPERIEIDPAQAAAAPAAARAGEGR
jgi:membrane protease subunit HflC